MVAETEKGIGSKRAVRPGASFAASGHWDVVSRTSTHAHTERNCDANVHWAMLVFAKELVHVKHPLGALCTSFDAHDLIAKGLPASTLVGLGTRYGSHYDLGAFWHAAGVSERTFHRAKSRDPDEPLSPEVSGKLWKFAEILGRATEVMGGREVAEDWLASSAIALDGRRPIDLLSTPAGTEAVEELLTRLAYDVYT